MQPLHVRAMAMAWAVFAGILALVLSSWCRLTDFAAEFWQVFHSLHPSPFTSDMLEPSLLRHILGVLIDITYGILDGFISGSLLAVFYNLFLPRPTSGEDKDQERP